MALMDVLFLMLFIAPVKSVIKPFVKKTMVIS